MAACLSRDVHLIHHQRLLTILHSFCQLFIKLAALQLLHPLVALPRVSSQETTSRLCLSSNDVVRRSLMLLRLTLPGFFSQRLALIGINGL
jgi:hypothetical protein